MLSKGTFSRLFFKYVLIVLFTIGIARAQNPNPNQIISMQTVNGDLTGLPGSIDNMPYDKRFRLNLKVTDDVIGGDFSYSLAADKHKLFLLDKFNSGADKAEAANKVLSFVCNGLNPNRYYIFCFDLFKKIPDDSKTKLKTAISTEIIQYTKKAHFDDTSYAQLKKAISDAVTKQLGVSVLANIAPPHAKTPVFQIIGSAELDPQIKRLYTLMRNMENSGSNFKNKAEAITNSATDDALKTLTLKLKDENLLTANSKKLYHQDLSAVTRFKGVDVGIANLYFTYLINNPEILKQLLSGDKSFDGGYYHTNTKAALDEDFIKLLDAYFKTVLQLQWTVNQHLETAMAKLDGLIQQIDQTINEYDRNNVNAQSSELNGVVAQLPDYLANYLTANALSVAAEVKVDVMSDNAPYISLDAGVGYNHAFNTFYTNYGVNIYVVPVDKTVKLKTYFDNPLLLVLKSTSLDIGIVNNYFNNQDVSKRYVALLGSNKDLFAGLGFRVNRFLKINAGLDCYYLKDANPVSTGKAFKAKFVGGLALDINIVKAFGSVGTAFGF